MERLPFEILDKIYIHLRQKDKLECMRVCRKWKYFIESNSLFHTIRISSLKQLWMLKRKVRKDPKLGEKVERLIIDYFEVNPYRPQTIMELFPNISVFMFAAPDIQNDPPPVNFPLVNSWCKNIQQIVECYSATHATLALTSGICSRLTTLHVRISSSSANGFINLLANAPSLKSLTMDKYRFLIEDFELLHEKVLSLSSLKIDCAFIPEGQLNFLSIKPVPSMTSLSIFSYGNSTISLHQYCCQKYPNLTELPTFYMFDCRNEKKKLKARYTSVLKSLGPNLKSYSLSTLHSHNYVLKMIERNGCRISTFTLNIAKGNPIKELIETNQVDYITKLTINSLKLTPELIFLKRFAVLSDLELYFSPQIFYKDKNTKIYLDLLLLHAPNTLKTISISHYDVYTSPSANDNDCFPSLKSLTISHAKIAAGVDTYISRTFPNLENLGIYYCTSENYTFNLPDSDLITFRFMYLLEYLGPHWRTRKLLVKTLCNSEERWYSLRPDPVPVEMEITVGLWLTHHQALFDISDMAPYPTFTSLRSDELNDERHITFVCNSVQDIYIM